MKKLLAVLMAVVMIACSFSLVSAKPDEATREGIGMNISGFNAHLLLSTETVSGSSIADYDLTFINYWATWCGPCVSEMPHIKSLYQHYEATPELDVQVIGAVSIGGDCTESSASTFLSQNGYNWPNVVPDSVLNAVFNTSGYIPQTLIVDRHGVVRDHIVGSFSSYNEMLKFVEMWRDVFNNHDGEVCTVSYVSSANNEVLATQEVPYGTVIKPLSSGSLPEVPGYTYSTMQFSDPNIYETGYPTPIYIAMGDCTITVIYTPKQYLVRFFDSITGKRIGSAQYVNYGSSATAPEPPEHEGYVFIGWDKDFSFITEKTDVYTIYVEANPPGVPGDMNGDGSISSADALVILRYAMGSMELTTEQLLLADYNHDGTVNSADALAVLRATM